ncbi:MAG: F-box protein [Gammaproteobacteria bacterium]|nr:F-box protein [Gammaproteobacteria bacterium]
MLDKSISTPFLIISHDSNNPNYVSLLIQLLPKLKELGYMHLFEQYPLGNSFTDRMINLEVLIETATNIKALAKDCQYDIKSNSDLMRLAKIVFSEDYSSPLFDTMKETLNNYDVSVKLQSFFRILAQLSISYEAAGLEIETIIKAYLSNKTSMVLVESSLIPDLQKELIKRFGVKQACLRFCFFNLTGNSSILNNNNTSFPLEVTNISILNKTHKIKVATIIKKITQIQDKITSQTIITKPDLSSQVDVLNSEENNNNNLGQLYDEILLDILSRMVGAKDYIHLSQVNKNLNRIIRDPSTTWGFFKQNYNFLVSHYILSPDFYTASHIRAGNRLIFQAMKIIKANGYTSEAEFLFLKAMYKHGSYHAMEFIRQLGSQGARCRLNIDFDNLIPRYQEKAEDILINESKTRFKTEQEQSDCAAVITTHLEILNITVNTFISLFMRIYRRDNGVSPQNIDGFNISFIRERRADSEPAMKKMESLEAEYELQGFIGMREPKGADSWYLHTESHAKFVKLEEVFQTLFQDYIDTNSTTKGYNTPVRHF